MKRECKEIKNLFDELYKQPKRLFPQDRKELDVPSEQGVYIIRKNKTVLHVGRTTTAKEGIKQRLDDHLSGTSSFVKKYLKGNGKTLQEDGYTYQYLVLENPRKRALLEAYAIGMLCPEHLGLN
jgi:hypothetical protein